MVHVIERIRINYKPLQKIIINMVNRNWLIVRREDVKQLGYSLVYSWLSPSSIPSKEV